MISPPGPKPALHTFVGVFCLLVLMPPLYYNVLSASGRQQWHQEEKSLTQSYEGAESHERERQLPHFINATN